MVNRDAYCIFRTGSFKIKAQLLLRPQWNGRILVEHVVIGYGRAFGVLLLRETRAVFGAFQTGYFWSLATPAFGVALLTLISGVLGYSAPIGASLPLFFLTGMVSFELCKKLSGCLMPVFNGCYEQSCRPDVSALELVLARSLLIVATYVLALVALSGSLIFFGWAHFPANPQALLGATASTALLGISFGTFNAICFMLLPTWTLIESFLIKALFFGSGVFFVPQSFSSDISRALSWNPLLHCIEWMREGYYFSYNSVVLDKSYVLVCCAVLLLIGLAGECLARKKRFR